MIRLHWILGSVVLLGTGLIGLALTEAQTKAPKGLPAGDLRKVKAFQERFNRVMDKVISLGREADEKGEGGSIVDEDLWFGFIDEKFATWDFTAKKPTTLKEIQVLKTNVNRRLDEMSKNGRLTPLDQQLLEKKTVTDMAKLLRR